MRPALQEQQPFPSAGRLEVPSLPSAARRARPERKTGAYNGIGRVSMARPLVTFGSGQLTLSLYFS